MTAKESKWNILVVPPNSGGCAYYRAILPAEKLSEHCSDRVNVKTELDPLGVTKTEDKQPMNVEENELLNWADIVMISNIPNFGVDYLMTLISQCKKLNKLVHYDNDDYLMGLYEEHRMYDAYHEHQIPQTVQKVFRAGADLVTVTTDKLADKISGDVGGTLAVVTNAIDYNAPHFNSPKAPSKATRIGWVGGIHHSPDVKVFSGVANAVTALVGRERVSWNLFGRPPHKEGDWQQSTWDDYVKYLSVGSKGNTNVFPSMTTDTYGQFYSHMDVSIAPLAVSTFNECKSEIKAMETGKYGIPLVATNVGAYDSVIENGHNGYLIPVENSSSDWKRVLVKLCKDKKHREELGRNLHKSVIDRYDINKVISERVDLYDEVFKGLK